VRFTAIDEVNFFDSGGKSFESGIDLGDHASGNGAVIQEISGFTSGDRVNERIWICGILHQAGDVGEVDELCGFQRAGESGGGEVGIDVEGMTGAVLSSQWRDHGDFSSAEGIEDVFDMTGGGFSDTADIGRIPIVIGAHELVGEEDGGAVDRGGLGTEIGEGPDEALIDLPVKGFFDDFDGFGRGDAEAADESRFEAGLYHSRGNGLAAAMHDDRLDAGHFEKNDIAHDLADEVRIVHGGPTHFDEKGFSPEALEVGEGFGEDAGFFGGSHGRKF